MYMSASWMTFFMLRSLSATILGIESASWGTLPVKRPLQRIGNAELGMTLRKLRNTTRILLDVAARLPNRDL